MMSKWIRRLGLSWLLAYIQSWRRAKAFLDAEEKRDRLIQKLVETRGKDDEVLKAMIENQLGRKMGEFRDIDKLRRAFSRIDF